MIAAVLAFGCLLAPGRARADDGPGRDLRVFIRGDEVRAGEVVVIRWNDPGADVPELEILLSLDGGQHYPLRVTPELDPRAGRYRWRVPNLSSGDARLRIRFGHGIEERWGEPGASFRIVGAPGAVSLDQFCENGWWKGLDGFPGAPGAGALDPGADSFVRGALAVGAATVPVGPGDLRPNRAPDTRGRGPLPATAAPPRAGGTPPTLMVMRN
jgi:hypothetical protein